MHIWGENYIPKNDKNISWQQGVVNQIRELPGNYPIFTVVMAIYHYIERIWRILVTPILYITYMIINIYYPVEPVNIHIQSLINIIQENNWVITNKKG